MKALRSVNRRTELDALRILAAFMVVVIHVSVSHWEGLPSGSLPWFSVSLYHSLASCAVPLFVMITGTAFLCREELPSLKTLFTKYILRLTVIYFFWSAAYALTDCSGLRDFLAKTLTGGRQHLWYLPRIVGTYALLPLLWAVTRWEKGRYVPYICGMCLLFITLKDTALALPLPESVGSLLHQFEFPLNSFAPFVLLGWYLSQRETLPKCRWLLLIFFLTAVGKAALNIRVFFDSNTNIFVYVLALSLFAAFCRLKGKPWLQREAVVSLASHTLGVYLIHIFVLEQLAQRLSLTTESFSQILSVPALSLLVFLISLAVTAVLRKIPYLGKYIL